MGDGPALLLLHGAGGATHSWRDIAPRLAERFTVIAPDLPGHGFTERPSADRMTLEGIATGVFALLDAFGAMPNAIVGHSAGGALALHMSIVRPMRDIVGINAALKAPSTMLSGLIPAASAIARSRLVAGLTAKLADSDVVFDALMQSTGSRIGSEQLALYRAFARSSERTGGVMAMFAGWDLVALERELPAVRAAVTLIVGARDGWVPPSDSDRAAARMPNARVVTLPNAGHLAHEELPERTCEVIIEALARPSAD